MKNVLYIGNYLQHNKTNKTYMHSLGTFLSAEGYYVEYSSSKKLKTLRLVDMILSFFYNLSKSEIILIDTYSTLNFYYALIISQLCRIFKKNYIPILHGGQLASRLEKNKFLSNLIFRNSKVNVSPSIYLSETFKDFGYENTVFIPNAIELDHYSFTNRNTDSIKMFWLRSFTKIYNPSLAIKVARSIQEKGINVELYMVGPNNDGSMDDCKSLAKKLKIKVHFTGKLKREDWIKTSKNCNVFINTSNIDNMPVSVIEAMALGLPIVSTNVGGMPYLIKHLKDGVLVEPNNEEAMANAVIVVCNNQELCRTMVANARQKVENFDWKIVKQQWNQILN